MHSAAARYVHSQLGIGTKSPRQRDQVKLPYLEKRKKICFVLLISIVFRQQINLSCPYMVNKPHKSPNNQGT